MILGIEKLEGCFDKLSMVDMEKATGKAIELVQRDAKALVSSDSGELRDSIYTDVSRDGNKVIGTCFTNKEYAAYVEVGTGPKGQQNHEGISPDVNPVYTQSPWWIHESQIDKGLAEKYHWFYIDTKDGRFYQCTGQPAKPYMYPALHNNRENIADIFNRQIEMAMKGKRK